VRNIYLVVHPEATHHLEGVVGGWHDSQLTPAGERAAASIAGALRARIPMDADVELFFVGSAACPAHGQRGGRSAARGTGA